MRAAAIIVYSECLYCILQVQQACTRCPFGRPLILTITCESQHSLPRAMASKLLYEQE